MLSNLRRCKGQPAPSFEPEQALQILENQTPRDVDGDNEYKPDLFPMLAAPPISLHYLKKLLMAGSALLRITQPLPIPSPPPTRLLMDHQAGTEEVEELLHLTSFPTVLELLRLP